MKFDTSSGPAGNSAILESRILYPKREEQCLQFFYKMNGSPGDKLVIWVRTDDGTGNIRSVKKIHTITGTFFFKDSFCRLMAKFIFTNCDLSSTWPSPLSMTSSITKVPPTSSDLLPSSRTNHKSLGRTGPSPLPAPPSVIPCPNTSVTPPHLPLSKKPSNNSFNFFSSTTALSVLLSLLSLSPRLIVRISIFLLGDGDATWKIAHVTLKVTDKFRYFFQGIKGSNSTSGSILLDDITLSETVCPIAVWQIQNFTGLLDTTLAGSSIKSKCFANSEGYSFGMSVYPNGRDSDYPDYVSMTMHLCSGENDAVLEWPVKNRQATIVVMDQDPDVKLRMSSARSFTTGT